ncbi:MAG: hypothetical protein KGY75_01980 [Candidatus Cloacimonetes bacterium]|nr:hypothetical protein [Candidatus Cloacimonadota bacterium]MBS3766881.1 hypothetical protein [Candidatus Cloacimonadota bacterium]
MCKKKCQHPEKLKGKDPSECSEEQIKECHGEEATKKTHECEKDSE